jgi:uncharacterized protein YjbI with pentapeptide repeats
MNIEIRHRFTDNVMFARDAENMREAIEKAVSAGANLARANLAGAYLAGANLDGANLARANLAGAYLAGATLDGAYLAGANLAGAYLAGANLAGETLSIAPVQVLGLTWPVLITPEFMRIGCQRHSHADWEAFDRERIRSMSCAAEAFWDLWRTPLLILCMQHRQDAARSQP